MARRGKIHFYILLIYFISVSPFFKSMSLFSSEKLLLHNQDSLSNQSILNDSLGRDLEKEIVFKDSIPFKEYILRKVNSIESKVTDLDNTIDSIKHEKGSRIDLYFVAIIAPLISSILTFLFATISFKRQEKNREEKLTMLIDTLSTVLIDEAEDMIARCCYLVECHAEKTVSKASLPSSARNHLMNQFSKISTNDVVLTSLTNIYNHIDRIKTHQDKAVEFVADNNKEAALNAQGTAVAFILNSLPNMLVNLEKIRCPISISLLNRAELINDKPSIEAYSVLSFLFQNFINEEINDEQLKQTCGNILLLIYNITGVKKIDIVYEEIKSNYLENLEGKNYCISKNIFEKLMSTMWARRSDMKRKLEGIVK